MPLIFRLIKGAPVTFLEGDNNLRYLEGLAVSSSANFNNWTGSSLSQFAGTASLAITASYALNAGTTVDTGSLVSTASFNAFTSSYYNDSSSFDQRISSISFDSSSLATTESLNLFTSSYYQDSASFDQRISSISFDSSSLLTTESFNNFTSSYNTGSFTGSFTGQLIGTASWANNATNALTANFVNLIQGPGIIINGLEITSSVRTVNGIFPTDGNIPISLSATVTGTSASLASSGSGNITGSIPDGLVWIISNDPTPSNNGDVYIYSSGSVGAWYQVAPLDQAASDARYIKLDGANTPMTGDLNMGGNNINNVGNMNGTASFAISASWAPFIATPTGSLLTTASVSSNTITFTKGDGSTFPITVNTGSGGSGLSGGTQFRVPVWTDSASLGTSSLYESGSVLKTVYSGSDMGLYFDFANKVFNLGSVNPNIAGLQVAIVPYNDVGIYGYNPAGEGDGLQILMGNTNQAYLGFYNSGNSTYLQIDDDSQFIKTFHSGNNIGLNLDFANNNYDFGDENNARVLIENLNSFIELVGGTTNGTLFRIDDNFQIIKTRNQGNEIGLKLDFASASYSLGDYNNTSGSTKLVIDDTTQTVTVSGSTVLSGSLFVNNLTTGSTSNVLTYDTTTGQVFFTASSAIGGATINTGSFLTTGSLSTTQQLSGSLNITGSLNFFSGSTNAAQISNGWVVLSQVSMSLDFANDTAAAAGGVPLGGLYRNGNAISIRIA